MPSTQLLCRLLTHLLTGARSLLTQICSAAQMPPNDDFMQSLSGTLQVDDCLIPNYMLLMLQGNFGLLCDSGMFNEPGPGEATALVHTMLSAAHVRHAPKEQAGDGGSERKWLSLTFMRTHACLKSRHLLWQKSLRLLCMPLLC